MSLRAVVVEDQAVARRHLRSLLAELDGIEWVGEAGDGVAALEVIARLRPDLVFLDIELPGLSGLEVLRRAAPRPLAIFTTAYDRHAVTAFELQALDYVLKPFGAERLRTAVDRARATVGDAGARQIERAEAALAASDRLRRVFARRRGRIVPVLLDDVEHLLAQGDYVELRHGGRTDLIRIALGRLHQRLDPAKFVRIHRSHVINLERVQAFVPTDDGRLEILLDSGTKLLASRSRTVRLRERLRIE